MQGARRSSEVRQAELIDAALHIIATEGIAALSTRSLAERVGLSSGALFRHFASLDALLAAVVARVATVLDGTYPPAGLAPHARLLKFIEARSHAVGQQVGIFRLVVSEQFSLALPPAAAATLAGCVQKSQAFVLACLREGQLAGEFRADLPPAALAVVVMGTIQMLALNASAGRIMTSTASADLVRTSLMMLLTPDVPPASATQSKRKRSKV